MRIRRISPVDHPYCSIWITLKADVTLLTITVLRGWAKLLLSLVFPGLDVAQLELRCLALTCR